MIAIFRNENHLAFEVFMRAWVSRACVGPYKVFRSYSVLVLVILWNPDPQAARTAPPRSALTIIESDNEPELIGDALRRETKTDVSRA